LEGSAVGLPLVRLTGITKRFPGVVANADVSIDIHPGEVHALLGENGAGKSTLIAILAGVQRPDAGTIEVGGQPVAMASPREAIRRGIGTVYQHSTLVPTLTVAENLTLGRPWWKGMGRPEVLRRFAELSALLGISVDPDAEAGTLSLGQQQQIEIMKALWRGERVLVLDEPTSMLTPQGVEELGQAMMRLRDAGLAVVFVTHKLNEVLAFGDRVSVLKLGRLVGGIPPPRFRAMAPDAATETIVELMFGRDAREAAEAEEFAGHADLRRAAPLPPGAPVLEVDGLSTPAAPRHVALAGISFALRAGEVLGIAGVDGNGQKQLAEALAGQLPGASGRIHLDGEDVAALNVAGRQRLGLRYLTDDRLGEGTVGSFPLALNLVLKRIGTPPFWRRGIADQGAIRAHAEEMISRYDIRVPGPDTPIGKLSGGNIQKALFGRELMGTPRVVIFNKPTYGLDLANIRAARQRIRDAADAGVAVLLISTELDELLELSDRIGVMVRGRLVGIEENGPDAARRVGQLMVAGGA
jgi:simple sugar transport system ATP-binding protein